MSIINTQSTKTKAEAKVKKSSVNSKDPSVLKGITDDLLKLMGTTSSSEVSYDQENDTMVVTIEGGAETGLLIGRKGETLTSIQVALGILLKQKTDEWQRVVVNVGDYREKEEDYLRNLGLSAASRAKETGQPQSLYNLTPAQRRIVHMVLSEDPQVLTESEGEGTERHLVVSVKE
jgi:spoIIIJ-associated protein